MATNCPHCGRLIDVEVEELDEDHFDPDDYAYYYHSPSPIGHFRPVSHLPNHVLERKILELVMKQRETPASP